MSCGTVWWKGADAVWSWACAHPERWGGNGPGVGWGSPWSGTDRARREAYGDNIMETSFLSSLLGDIHAVCWTTSPHLGPGADLPNVASWGMWWGDGHRQTDMGVWRRWAGMKEQTKSNQWPSWVHPSAYIPCQTLNFLKILFLYLSDWAVPQPMLVFPSDTALFIPYFVERAAGSLDRVTQTVVTHGCRLICAIWTLPALINWSTSGRVCLLQPP